MCHQINPSLPIMARELCQNLMINSTASLIGGSFFKLSPLLYEEINYLQSADISIKRDLYKTYYYIGNMNDLNSLESDVYNVIEYFNVSNNLNLSHIVRDVIEDVIFVTKVAGIDKYMGAAISVIAQKPSHYNKLADWHVDKMLCEITQNTCSSNSSPVAIMSLFGQPTLYLSPKVNNDIINIDQLIESCSDTTDVYCDIFNNDGDKKIASKLLKAHNIVSAPPGHGSLHLAGSFKGTFHASPGTGNRFLIIFKFGSKTDMEVLKSATKRSTVNFFDQFYNEFI